MSAEARCADTTPLPSRVEGKPSEAIPIVESRLTEAYGADVAELVMYQLEAWDDLGYSSEYTGVLWSVSADVTGQPIADYDEVQTGVDAWRNEGIAYQPRSHADARVREPTDPALVEDAVRDVMALSRHTAQQRLGSSVTVYRGLFDRVWHEYVTETKHAVKVEEPAAMEAWTLNRQFAENHGDHTLRMTVDTDDVLFFGELFQERQYYRMQELTLGHGEYSAAVIDTL